MTTPSGLRTILKLSDGSVIGTVTSPQERQNVEQVEEVIIHAGKKKTSGVSHRSTYVHSIIPNIHRYKNLVVSFWKFLKSFSFFTPRQLRMPQKHHER
jgi:hypothetical protein